MKKKYDSEKHHRRSVRLKGYDYSQEGAYFVTICTQDQKCLLGEIVGGEMQLNTVGRRIQTIWNEIPTHYTYTKIDTFVVMPNHVHGIITLVGAGPRACPDIRQPQGVGQPQGVAPTRLSLSDAIHRFKSLTTARYRHGVKQYGWLPFTKRLWQRNYYEHIVRNKDELNRIREYITNNPLQWQFDRENSNRVYNKTYNNQWGNLEEAIYGEAKKITPAKSPP